MTSVDDGAAPREAVGDVVLRAVDVVKTYGATEALKGVNFEVRRGKVTALFGENGAGKSTLMRILAGIEPPTAGYLELDGTRLSLGSPNEARAVGIAIIHQELNMCPNLSVRDNIFLGHERTTWRGSVDYGHESELALGVLARLEQQISPETLVGDLRLGQQQIVEIARALADDARILIMDEPTSALSPPDVAVLFRTIKDLAERGVAIVYISHHLEEAMEIADHAVVFRDGSLVAKAKARDIDLPWVVQAMVGRAADYDFSERERSYGNVRLSVEGLTVVSPGGSGRLSVDDVSLEVRAGEIVCLYGLMGAGRTELMEALAGREPIAAGQVLLEGKDVSRMSIGDRIRSGMVLVPEDRQRDGLVPLMSVGQNLSLSSLTKLVRGPFIQRKREAEEVDAQVSDMRVKTPSGGAAITSLSGGNQQKVVVGRAFMTQPSVLLLDEPTRGIDVGAKAEIFALLFRSAERGLGVLFVTSEVSEALSASHRIIVMNKGRVAGQFDPARTTQAEVMAASGEAHSDRPNHEKNSS